MSAFRDVTEYCWGSNLGLDRKKMAQVDQEDITDVIECKRYHYFVVYSF